MLVLALHCTSLKYSYSSLAYSPLTQLCNNIDTKDKGKIMKTSKAVVALLLFSSVYFTLYATNIDEQISAIINAPAEQRVELVNQFKQTVAAMSAEDRLDAINQMRSSMQATNLQTQTKVHQTQNSQNIEFVQKMNQQSTASQAKNQGKIGSGSVNQDGVANKFMGNK